MVRKRTLHYFCFYCELDSCPMSACRENSFIAGPSVRRAGPQSRRVRLRTNWLWCVNAPYIISVPVANWTHARCERAEKTHLLPDHPSVAPDRSPAGCVYAPIGYGAQTPPTLFLFLLRIGLMPDVSVQRKLIYCRTIRPSRRTAVPQGAFTHQLAMVRKRPLHYFCSCCELDSCPM